MGVEPSEDEFDDEADAQLEMRITEVEPPMELDPGQTIRVRGTWCEPKGCRNTFGVWTGDDHTLIALRIVRREHLHPSSPVLATFGLSAAEFTAPLVLSESPADVCPALIEEGEDACLGQGQRLVLEVDSPADPPARLLSGTRGQGGSGYWVVADELEQWEGGCGHNTRRSFFILRQDCAPDCGPVATADACVPELGGLDPAWMWFPDYDKEPSEELYDITCVVLDQYQSDGRWIHELDCVGIP